MNLVCELVLCKPRYLVDAYHAVSPNTKRTQIIFRLCVALNQRLLLLFYSINHNLSLPRGTNSRDKVFPNSIFECEKRRTVRIHAGTDHSQIFASILDLTVRRYENRYKIILQLFSTLRNILHSKYEVLFTREINFAPSFIWRQVGIIIVIIVINNVVTSWLCNEKFCTMWSWQYLSFLLLRISRKINFTF